MDDEQKMGGDPISTPAETGVTARLTRRQRVFVEHYLRSWNATRAAETAGYAHARQAGSRMLSNVVIQAAIKARLTEAALEADEVLYRLAEMARSDIGRFFKISERETDTPLPSDEIISERKEPILSDDIPLMRTIYTVRRVVLDMDALLDPERSRLVKKFSDSAKSGLSIELYDAQSALVQIGKHLGLMKDKPGDVNVNIYDLEDWKKRAQQNAVEMDQAMDALEE